MASDSCAIASPDGVFSALIDVTKDLRTNHFLAVFASDDLHSWAMLQSGQSSLLPLFVDEVVEPLLDLRRSDEGL